MATVLARVKKIKAIPSSKALEIADADAKLAYDDLSLFEIRLNLETDGWHVDYDLKDKRRHGGGPHYVIDASTGSITAKRYEQ